MSINNSERPNTEPLSEPKRNRILVDLLKRILAVAILAEVIGVWIIAFRIISRVRVRTESPRFVLIAVALGLSLIGWGFAKWLYPKIPGIAWTKALKYVFGVLLAAYALYPTYENFRASRSA